MMTETRRKSFRHDQVRVFLSGRIDGLDHGSAASWRQRAKGFLFEAGMSVYDPTAIISGTSNYAPTPNEVFTNDRWNLARADVLLVNLDLPETIRSRDAPFFTIGEMFLAHHSGHPIITFGGCFDGRPGFEAIVTRSFTTLDEALAYIVKAYRPDRPPANASTGRSALPSADI